MVLVKPNEIVRFFIPEPIWSFACSFMEGTVNGWARARFTKHESSLLFLPSSPGLAKHKSSSYTETWQFATNTVNYDDNNFTVKLGICAIQVWEWGWICLCSAQSAVQDFWFAKQINWFIIANFQFRQKSVEIVKVN